MLFVYSVKGGKGYGKESRDSGVAVESDDDQAFLRQQL